jgi:hypothetical protein
VVRGGCGSDEKSRIVRDFMKTCPSSRFIFPSYVNPFCVIDPSLLRELGMV